LAKVEAALMAPFPYRHSRKVTGAFLGCWLTWSLSAHAECSKITVCKGTSAQQRPRPKPLSSSSATVVVTGVVLTGVGTIALLGGAALTIDRSFCKSTDSYQYGYAQCSMSSLEPAAWIGGALSLAVGIPLIVIGARRRATALTPTATLSTWTSVTRAGFALRVEL
jgi:hypothetical protein